MKAFRFYHQETGILADSILTLTDMSGLAANIPAGHSAIEGDFDHLSQRVDIEKANAQRDAYVAAHAATAVPPLFLPNAADVITQYQPPQPSADHEWNPGTRRWRLSAEVQQRNEARAAAQARITELERDTQPALLRALALGQEGAREKLAALDAEIVQLRKVSE